MYYNIEELGSIKMYLVETLHYSKFCRIVLDDLNMSDTNDVTNKCI